MAFKVLEFSRTAGADKIEDALNRWSAEGYRFVYATNGSGSSMLFFMESGEGPSTTPEVPVQEEEVEEDSIELDVE